MEHRCVLEKASLKGNRPWAGSQWKRFFQLSGGMSHWNGKLLEKQDQSDALMHGRSCSGFAYPPTTLSFAKNRPLAPNSQEGTEQDVLLKKQMSFPSEYICAGFISRKFPKLPLPL